MKKTLLSLNLALAVMAGFAQLDTIIGFSFPINTGIDSLNANYGISVNLGYNIQFLSDTPAAEGDITFTNGVYSSSGTDYAATAEYWNNCANNKYWSIKFKTTGYENIVVYSKQRSGGNDPGPAHFKMQYRISSSGVWADFGPDTIHVANDWTTGAVDSVELPSAAWDAGQSVYIRWIAISNESSDGGTIDTTGVSKIDEIFIKGSAISAIDESDFVHSVYPNPTTGILNIESNIAVDYVRVMGLDGRMVAEFENPGNILNIDFLPQGVFMVQFFSEHENRSVVRKIIKE